MQVESRDGRRVIRFDRHGISFAIFGWERNLELETGEILIWEQGQGRTDQINKANMTVNSGLSPLQLIGVNK